MADPPKHKYRTRASMNNQNVGNGNIVYNDQDSSSSDVSDYSESAVGSRKKQFQRSNNKRRKHKEQSNTINDVPEIPELQYPSKWLSQTVATKLAYYPQIGDTVVYFYQGHEIYLKAVKEHYNYEHYNSLPQLSLQAHHYCQVTGMKFKYPEICCLKLSILDDDGHFTGEVFTVKYHYLSQLHDFIVLKQVFDEALEQKFSIGMKVCSCENQNGALERLHGTIESIEPIDMKFPTSHFMCCRVRWDNGNFNILSPWEFEPLDNQNLPRVAQGMAPVLPRDIRDFLYQPEPDEWPLQNQDLVCDKMIKYLDQLIYMVDIDIYPDYAKVVAYPVTLLIIRARLENKFYRRITALKFDLRNLLSNAEVMNEPNSQIVKQTTIFTNICFDIIKDIDKELDIQGLYDKALSRSYVTSDSDMEVESIAVNKSSASTVGSSPKKRTNDDRQIGVHTSIPSTSFTTSPERQPIRKTAVFPNNIIGNWKSECRQLLKVIWNDDDSIRPFRNPVDPIEFPDYEHIVPIQMCLQWVRNSLEHEEYKNPKNFEKDMKMIFSNSRLYNTNKNTDIYKMTTRLSYLFESFMESIIARWTGKRNAKQKEKSVKVAENARNPMMDAEEDSSSSDNDEDDENSDSDYVPETQSTMDSEDLSQITVDLSQISTNSSSLVANVTNFEHAEDDTHTGNDNKWDEGWTQVLAQTPILDLQFYNQ